VIFRSPSVKALKITKSLAAAGMGHKLFMLKKSPLVAAPSK
jgi:hypothetical protein